MSESIEVHPIVFPPEVLARISPDISLQRHISLGIRPCAREFEEFRDVVVSDGNLSRYSEKCQNTTSNNVIGSNVLRSGKTFVITSITGGIVEETLPADTTDDVGEQEMISLAQPVEKLSENATVFPVVEVQRGRGGGATDEEMITSERLHKTLLHSGLLKKKDLSVSCGIRRTNDNGDVSILYDDELGEYERPTDRKWSYVLYAKIHVFSRDGPIFDLCWNSLIYALRSVRLPRAFLDERAADLKIAVRTRGRSMTIRETYDILCDPEKSKSLQLNNDLLAYSSSFGLIDIDPLAQLSKNDDEMEVDKARSVLLADIETEAEESSIQSTLSFVTDKQGQLKSCRIIGGGAKITPDIIKRSIDLSKKRAVDVGSKHN